MIPLPVILAELLTALGSALLLANVWALVRPRFNPEAPPLKARGRVIANALIGALVAVWGFASFITKI
ncbi:MAG: hypothetical protein NVSMB57_05900 [Actinomycetota bacterium]